MRNLSIKVIIANRPYPLTVNNEQEEEAIRKAAKRINDILKDYESKYAVKDKQDLLAMCALEFATKSIEIESKNVVDDGLREELEGLEALVSKLV
ncbi:cell division protein ZapA [Vicingaceae bacterium]|nr:cell division protein ZapA [Vicingaceae bacterium]